MKYYILLFISMFLIGCNSNEKGMANEFNHSSINLSDKVIEVSQLPLSDAVRKVEVVPLETTDESLLDEITMVEVTDESIFICSKEILRFARNGKFLNKIGRKGEGPEEYTYINDIQIDESKGEVYVITTANGILVYDFEGSFKRQVINHTSLARLFLSINNRQYLLFGNLFFFTQAQPFSMPVKEDSIRSLIIADNQFQVNKIFYNPTYLNRLEAINENHIGKANNYWVEYPISIDTYHDEVTLKYPDNDTIYVFDQANQQLKPQYTIYSNEPKGDYEKTHLWIKERSAFDYFSIYSYYPSKGLIYLVGSKGDEIYTFAYNKTDATVRQSKRQGTITEFRFPWNATYRRIERPFILSNDICGGDFNIRFRSQGKYWIDVQAQNYENYTVDLEKVSSSKVKNEQNKQALLETFNNLNEDSNPVLLIGILK